MAEPVTSPAAAPAPARGSRAIDDILPLTPPQRGMLFESLAHPGTGIHLEQMHVDLVGDLDEEALEAAWTDAARRHAALRTCFVWRNQEEPLQVVLRQVEVVLRREDWSGVDAAEREERFRRHLEEDVRAGFDLAKAPLFRLTLLRFSAGHHRLLWSQHHILMDGWCQPLLLGRILAAYRALRQGRPAPEVDERPYRDFVRWLQHRDQDATGAFWTRSLAGFDRPTPLGRTIPEAAPEAAGWGEARGGLDRGASDGLRAFGRRHELTLNTVVQGAWAVLLAHHGGAVAASGDGAVADDVVFGITVSGRPAELAGIETTVGLFINTLPVRVRLVRGAALAPQLALLQRFNLELREHEHSAPALVRGAAAVPAAQPLYESLLVYENYPVAPSDVAQASDLGVELRTPDTQGARTGYPLTLLVQPGAEVRFLLVHDRGRVAAADAELWVRHLELLLGALARAQGDTRVADLLAALPDGEVPRVRRRRAGRRPDQPPLPPRTPLEERLLAVWRRVLGVPGLGVEDDFFAVGGHSLLAAELVEAVRRELAVELPLSALFAAPTIAGLAEAVAARRASGESVTELPRATADPQHAAEPFPLTDIQQAYWIGRTEAFELGNVATHSYSEIDARGLDLERLQAAWVRLVERHGMLRAVITDDGQQRILPTVPPYRIAVLELGDGSAEEEAEALARVREEMSHHVLPADRWPLFDLRASRLGDGRLRLHLSFDLLIGDGLSWRILGEELVRLYVEPGASLPALEITFRDYVTALESLRRTPLAERSRRYWLERVSTLPGPPALPLARRPAEIDRPRFARLAGRLEGQAWERLKQRGAEAGLTPSGLLLAVFSEVLRAWSSEPRFTVNLTLFNRLPLHPDVHRLVGDFTSLTLLAAEDWRSPTFQARARSLQQRLWEDLDHRLFSGVEVQRELSRVRGGGGAVMPVIFTSTLTLDAMRQQGETLEMPGELAMVYSIGQTPQVWLDHQVSEDAAGLSFVWDSVEGLFPAGMLDDMFDAYRGLLDRLACDEGAWTGGPRELVPPEHLARRQRVTAAQPALPPSTDLLHTLWRRHAREAPQRPAVIAAQRSLSYGELAAAAGALGRRLAAAGTATGELVAVVMEKGWEQVVAVLGVLEAGGAYLPVDASHPSARVRRLVELGGCRRVVTQPHLLSRLDLPPEVEVLTVEPEPEPAGAAGGADLAPPRQQPEDLAYVIFTSGSSGEPKGVMIDHRGAVNTLRDLAQRFAIAPGDRVLGLSSLAFDLSVWDVFGTLAAGGALVLPEPEARRDPSRWLHLVERHGVTVWNSVPALLEMLVEYAEPRHGGALAGLRLALLSGDWIPVGLPDRLRALAPAAEVVSLGGATEASIWSVLYPVETVAAEWKSIPYGHALRNQRLEVLDATLRRCPDGVPGDLYIGGVGLAQGYWRDPRRTATAFVPDPLGGGRLYRTGDRARFLADGELEFLGRVDQQVKIRGHRIELGEIEAALEVHPRVRQAAARVVGEGSLGRRLAAYVVPREAGPGGLPDDGGRVVLERPPHGSPGRPWAARETPPLRDDRPQAPRLDLPAVSRLLALLRGEESSSGLPTFLYPSAGSLYPVQAYLLLAGGSGEDTADGLPAGAWWYHPMRHTLVPVGDRAAGFTADVFGGGPAARVAAGAIVLVADRAAIEPLYGDLWRELVLLEAGYAGELLAAFGSAQGVDIRPLAGFDAPAVAGLLGLEQGRTPVYAALLAGTTAERLPAVPREVAWEDGGGAGGRAFADRLAGGGRGGTLDAVGKLQFKLEQHGLRHDLAAVPPRPLPAATPEMLELLARRRSHRAFRGALTPARLSRALAALAAQADGARGYPAVGGGYLLEARLHVRRGGVAGLPAGGWRYLPGEHALEPVAPGAALAPEVHGAVNREAAESCAFSLYLLARRGDLEAAGPRGLDRALLEAGHAGQMLMIDAAADGGYGLCPLGGIEVERLRAALALDDDHLLVHTFLVGGLGDGPAPEGAATDLEETLLAHLRERLPEAMVPATVTVLAELPLSANGKVDRQALPEPRAAEPDGTAAGPAAAVAPRDGLEGVVARVVREVLGRERLGVHDNFFDLGGNSLHLVRAHRRLVEELGQEIPVVALFRNPTVASLAAALRAAAAGVAPEPEREERSAERKAGRERLKQRLRGRDGGGSGPEETS